ncbi:MAG: FAD-binding oxidoreductase [Gammaproteobacteria bacterium]|jgi:FAD/FMN-containing dehydrogenase|nr:FAD-binding oxidoreductase [Gammaproteobacteria bacterium]
MTVLIERLQEIVGSGGWTSDPQELQPHLTEWRGVYEGRALIMVKPRTTDEVVAIVRACADYNTAIVPQGGNTSMCGGAVPDASGEQVILNLSRMNRVLDVDAGNFSMTVEAGCLLATAQEAARAAGRYFPLSLGAEGSCQIGGNIATNAGGINVGRYGTARALVLGLEVVLANGTVLDNLRSLRKDTAGYDLKQLFIGSEGTLGIITAASLRLFPDPGHLATALVGIDSAGAAVELLGSLKTKLEDRIESFELVSRRVFNLVETHIPNATLPFEEEYPWYVLIEAATGADPELLASALLQEAEDGRLLDAVIAKNETEAADLWRLRHSIAEAERQDGKALKHDISVPLSKMQEFLVRGDQLLDERWPEARLVAFGHVGDGNLHYNVVLPRGLSAEEWTAEGERVTGALYDLVHSLNGSFSAEHGVGQSKKAYLASYRAGPELDLMRSLKKMLDPANILNPGKVI